MAIVGAQRVAEEYPDKLTVVIIPDSGRSYLSKIFNDEWMAENGFPES
jgi:cystathionine beta-synthase